MDRMLDMLKKAEAAEATYRSTLPPGVIVRDEHGFKLPVREIETNHDDGVRGMDEIWRRYQKMKQAHQAEQRHQEAEKKRVRQEANRTPKQQINAAWGLLNNMRYVSNTKHSERDSQHAVQIVNECCAINSFSFDKKKDGGALRRALCTDLCKLRNCKIYLAGEDVPERLGAALDTVIQFLEKRCALSPMDNLAVCYHSLVPDITDRHVLDRVVTHTHAKEIQDIADEMMLEDEMRLVMESKAAPDHDYVLLYGDDNPGMHGKRQQLSKCHGYFKCIETSLPYMLPLAIEQ